MQLILMIFILLINNVLIDSINYKNLEFFHALSISETSNSTTTERPFYPDTYSPGSIAGIVVGSFLLISIISFGTYQIGRRRFYYLPYYYTYQAV